MEELIKRTLESTSKYYDKCLDETKLYIKELGNIRTNFISKKIKSLLETNCNKTELENAMKIIITEINDELNSDDNRLCNFLDSIKLNK